MSRARSFSKLINKNSYITNRGQSSVADLEVETGSSSTNSATKTAVNTFTASQKIDVTDNTNPALKITQKGTGNALLVEDVLSDTTPFVIDANGKVGIGTTTLSELLEIQGNIKIKTSTDDWTISINGTNLIFSTGGVDKMKLDASGNLIVVGNVSAYGTV